MSRRVKLLTCALCAGAAVVWLAVTAAQAQDPPAADDTDAGGLAALRGEVQELQERVRQLEERLSKLEGGIQPLEFQFTPDGRAIPRAIPSPESPGRQPQGEINGVPYYIIPLGRE
jgi:hypothetical protein